MSRRFFFTKLSTLCTAVLACLCAWLFSACCSSDDGHIIPSSNPLPPIASILAQPSTVPDSLDVAFDAHESYDFDGIIVQYDWDLTSDGTYDVLDGGVTHDFTYPEAGTYRCTVRVTDDDGLTDTASILVTVPIATSPPTAAGTAAPGTVNPLLVRFDATSSFDTDGTIVRYDWDFDHNGIFDLIDGGPTPDFAFSTIGTYVVTVRVFDNDGLTDTADITVTITEGQGGNLIPPEAALTPNPASGIAPLGVTWDASDSTDSDGTIVRYDWDMDADGVFEVIGGGATRSTSYLVGGDYSVAVRVVDNDGGMDAELATAYVNDEPVALATSTPSAGDLALIQAEMKMTGQGSITVVFDGSTSFDPDGEIVQYDWDLDNDGEFEIIDGAVSQPVVYTASGVFAVALRVTDNEGATDTASAGADVNEPPTARLQPDPPSGTLALSQQTENWELPVTWHASTSFDPDGQIVRWDWDMDNDSTFEVINGPSSQDVTYTESGVYAVRMRVTDNDGATEIAVNSVDVNAPPTADLLASPAAGDLVLQSDESWLFETTFDASTSADIDGTIVRYDWDLDNDGVFEVEDGGVTQPMSYTTPGFHIVAVKVYDDDGATDNAAAGAAVNQPPTAVLTAGFMPLPELKETSAQGQLYWLQWDASQSFDVDGTIVRYDWDTDNDGEFDVLDGESTVSDMFNNIGTYIMGVRVTDDDGATDTAYTPYTVVGQPPVAVLTGEMDEEMEMQINWFADQSYDPDGAIVRYNWDYESDGIYDETTTIPFTVHTYSTYGMKECTVRVTDDDDLTDTASYSVYLNGPPVAILTGTFRMETTEPYRPCIDWDASESYDPDGGEIELYNWDLDANLSFEVSDGGSTETGYYSWDDTSASAWVEVIDDEGDVGYAYATVVFGLAPPIAILEGGPSEGSSYIYWDAYYSFDIDGTIVQYEWDFDGDGVYDAATTYPWIDHYYPTFGEKFCTVRVTDNDGLTGTATASYTLLAWPNADLFGYVSNFLPGGVEVTWDATGSSDPDGHIVEYHWDYDYDYHFDEVTTTSTVVHNYPYQNPIRCMVMVIDNDGLDGYDSYTLNLPE